MADLITWTSADGGTVLDFTDEGAGFTVLANGTRGLRSVTYETSTSKYAGQDGESVNHIRAIGNEVTLGLMVRVDGEAELRTKVRQLVHVMRPKVGTGVLSYTTSEGETRTLECYCIDGMQGDEATDATLAGSWWRVALKLYAPSPWWQGAAQSINFGLSAPTTFFPIFPLMPSASTVQGMFEVDLSDSDAPTYPQWTIVGPGSALLLENQTTGRQIQVNASLAGGETMFVDTRPGSQSIRRGDGTNLMSALSSDPALWPLVEDVNRVSAQLTGATSASRILGAFRPRYAGI
jgi:hypothetical protein